MSRCGDCKLGCHEQGAFYCEENLGYEQCIDRLQDALYAVDRLQGEWIDQGWHGDWQFETDGRGNCWYEYKCSECGYIKRGGKSNYCPNCGADMRGKDNE